MDYANQLGMEVMVDINPGLFDQLEISYDDLSFFDEMGAYGVRLDIGFTGAEEARMTRNPYGIKIEINMSSGTNYVDNIMSYSPNTNNLLGSHNFTLIDIQVWVMTILCIAQKNSVVTT